MLIKEFVKILTDSFGPDLVDLGQFTDPLYNPRLGTEFLDQSGRVIKMGMFSPREYDSVEMWEILGGPFYRLQLLGLRIANLPEIVSSDDIINNIVVIADNEGKKLESHCLIRVNASSKSVNEFCKKYGINWYGFSSRSSLYCVFDDFIQYTEFLKEDDVQSKKENT